MPPEPARDTADHRFTPARGSARQRPHGLHSSTPSRQSRERRHLNAVPLRPSPYLRWGKPLLDRVGAAFLLVVFAPLMALVALCVLVSLGAPVIFRQPRVGKEGEVFDVYKFRSMHHSRRQRSEPFDGPNRRQTHKHPHDPRLTRLGRFLRSSSLDELPQLLNVLRGQMSLVGPRPELVSIVEQYQPWQHERHLVKPGLTGLWQVKERSNGVALMHEHTGLDIEYVRRVSFWLDVKLLLLTIPVALGLRRGF